MLSAVFIKQLIGHNLVQLLAGSIDLASVENLKRILDDVLCEVPLLFMEADIADTDQN